VIGMVDDDPRKIGSKIDGYPVLSTTNAIPELVRKNDIGLILFAIADIQPTEQDRILSLCQTTSARITPVPDIIDNLQAQFQRNENEREVHFNKVLHNATIDRLTGAYNRQHFLNMAEVEFSRSQRYERPLTLVAVRINYERPAKASYTTRIATQVMQAAARHCRENIRGIDLLGRYQDDVLVILLPETDTEAANLVCQRIKHFITANRVETGQGRIKTLVEINYITSQQNEFANIEAMLAHLIEPLAPGGPSSEALAVGNTDLK
jgi:diguanylate cyclase (GGDEF)-like protein